MNFKKAAAILLVCAITGLAQDRIPDLLRKGILAEDSEQKPAAAIQQYQAVMNQFAEERQMAATALFRMAECYRKQGQKPQAIAAYQRVLREFADQPKLAQQSRNTLTTIYAVIPADSTQHPNPKNQAQAQAVIAARARYRATLEEEENIVEKQLSLVRQRQKAGVDGALSSAELEQKIQQLKRELAAFDAGWVRAPYSPGPVPQKGKGTK
jgi:tetratricopeptide (TPR) repeat protein